jgi:hypothetical protein
LRSCCRLAKALSLGCKSTFFLDKEAEKGQKITENVVSPPKFNTVVMENKAYMLFPYLKLLEVS